MFRVKTDLCLLYTQICLVLFDNKHNSRWSIVLMNWLRLSIASRSLPV